MADSFILLPLDFSNNYDKLNNEFTIILFTFIFNNKIDIKICFQKSLFIKENQKISREYLYSPLNQRIQLQNSVAGSIPRNSKFCIYIPKSVCNGHRRTSSLNVQKEVITVGSPEEPVHRTPTYDPMYGGGNGYGPKEYIRER